MVPELRAAPTMPGESETSVPLSYILLTEKHQKFDAQSCRKTPGSAEHVLKLYPEKYTERPSEMEQSGLLSGPSAKMLCEVLSNTGEAADCCGWPGS